MDAADPGTLITKYQPIAKAGKDLLRTDIPQELLPALVQLALKVKSATVSNVYLDVAKLRLKYLHPDYEGLRETVAAALDQKPASTPSTSTTPSTKTTTPKETTATPPPVQDLKDACAYNPDGDQPS